LATASSDKTIKIFELARTEGGESLLVQEDGTPASGPPKEAQPSTLLATLIGYLSMQYITFC